MPGVVVPAAAAQPPPLSLPLGDWELPLPGCCAAGPAAAIPPTPRPPSRKRAFAPPPRCGVGGDRPPSRVVPPVGGGGNDDGRHPGAAGAEPSPPCWRRRGGGAPAGKPGLPVTAHFLVGWGRRGAAAAAAGSVPDGLGGRRELRQAAMRAPGPAGRRSPP